MTDEAQALQEKQIQQAEELLFSGPQRAGFAKELFFGRFLGRAMLPFPELDVQQRAIGDKAVAEVREFVTKYIDPVAIDQQADIPPSVIRGLGEVRRGEEEGCGAE